MYDHKQKREAIKRVKRGTSCVQVAREIGCDEKTVRSWAKGKCLERSERKKKLLPKVVKLYEKHANVAEVARRLGVGSHMILDWLHEEGIETPNPMHLSEGTKKKIRKLYRKYHSTYVVADMIGVEPGTVLRWCKDLVPEHQKKRHFSEKAKNKARRLRKKGVAYPEIARQIGAYQPSVWLWCNS